MSHAEQAGMHARGGELGQIGRRPVRRRRTLGIGGARRGPVGQADLKEHSIAVDGFPVDGGADQQWSGRALQELAENSEQRAPAPL
jgi:hypothetical protein